MKFDLLGLNTFRFGAISHLQQLEEQTLGKICETYRHRKHAAPKSHPLSSKLAYIHTHIHKHTERWGGEGVEGDRHGYRPTRAKASQVNALSALIHKYPPPALINYKQSEPIQYCIIIFKQREAKGMYFLIDLFIWRT